ncbi:GNAT family N-acetyltransferase [Deinococcus sp. KNUC1210]|uniref:GNAT family N-acetyltransferase n=1 Tax=Deinococcus sp. KNUC1210 TaxID=2917691 RepID=UPI001EEFE2BE|nr:GNAT family N-acetyltransferase [Deinococcus sp. KNUC1210]ULH16264.1 GNAT family N-acetyltransferase [Deinococcus sp. KNUC1210]
MHIRRVTRSDDPAIPAFGRLQNAVYFEPDMLIPAQYIAQMLEMEDAGERRNVLLLAENDEGEVIGGSIFHYLASAETGFSSFLGVARSARGQGVARALHGARWAALQEVSGGRCRAVFIDVVNPQRESHEQQTQEAAAGSNALERRQRFHALGFRTVDLPYVQPVGGENGGPVTDMDLLAYLPGDPATLPTALAGATMQAYWTPWLGRRRAEQEARKLEAGAHGQPEVALLPAWEGPKSRA